jgi:hypothetical protein
MSPVQPDSNDSMKFSVISVQTQFKFFFFNE